MNTFLFLGVIVNRPIGDSVRNSSISDFVISPTGSLLSTPPTAAQNNGFSTSPTIDGDVTGALDALPLVIGNTSGLNDYLHFMIFGDSIDFRVGITHPDTLTGDSGSAFLFGLTSDDGLSPILTQDPSGFLGQIAYDQTGQFSVDQLSDFATITGVSEVPEPSTRPLVWVLLGVVVTGWVFRRVRLHMGKRVSAS